MDPLGIEVRVVDRDVPPTWLSHQRGRGDGRELLPTEAAALGVVDGGERIGREDVQVEMEPPRIRERGACRLHDALGVGGETGPVRELDAVAE